MNLTKSTRTPSRENRATHKLGGCWGKNGYRHGTTPTLEQVRLNWVETFGGEGTAQGTKKKERLIFSKGRGSKGNNSPVVNVPHSGGKTLIFNA